MMSRIELSAAPVITKSGAAVSFLSGFAAFLNEHTWFVSAVGVLGGLLIGLLGAWIQWHFKALERKREEERHAWERELALSKLRRRTDP